MVDEEIQDAVNEQINEEFESAYLYLAFSEYFESRGLDGFAHWMKAQWEEELDHAMKFYDHLVRRGGRVELETISKPEVELSSARDAFEQVLEHEREITRLIYELDDLANEKNDKPLKSLLGWFVDEQVEEEESAEAILDKLELIGGDGADLYLLDKELAERETEEEEE
jgi:ferritin